NKKRCISVVEPTTDRKMGHRMDTIYIVNRKETGCIEIGNKDDQTKAMNDGLLKMSIIMRDMLTQL
ncbi:hypothetical protein BDA99DRAFT_425942, partial [Phascolomyces articulosus]